METRNIRNFSIIAHIDHGKSTLADRMLEVTGTIEKRKMREQVLDKMDLERERGITIKMTPVHMSYKSNVTDTTYSFNLIDTPGHIDFSYEVSRAQKAVEGAILLVDATQGVQAQTLTTLQMARESGLVIIPVINKVDLAVAMVEQTKDEIVELVGCAREDILETSGKTGQGVENLLETIVEKVPAPKITDETASMQSLIFDFEYSTHQGIIVYVRVFEGSIKKGDNLVFKSLGEKFTALEVGTFSPDKVQADELSSGEIGYIVTGIKRAVQASVGDTITTALRPAETLPGYSKPKPVVWASLYPQSQDDFNLLRQSLLRLQLGDASLSFEEESSGSLGRGYRCGFLGMLHLEIITERIRREFNLELIVAQPTISYEIEYEKKGTEVIYSPAFFPDEGTFSRVLETWVSVKIITPPEYLNVLIPLFYEHEAEVGNIELFGDKRNSISLNMPLRELMRHFFEEVKSVSSGYASLSYQFLGNRPADVTRLDILVAHDRVEAFSRVVSKKRIEREAEDAVEKLKKLLPREMFEVRIQAQAMGRILASRSLPAMKKDVTGYLYGGDVTRKMKLLEKQKKGKKRMKVSGRVNISHDVFLKMMRND
jgi:GTP-binding protein LepA